MLLHACLHLERLIRTKIRSSLLCLASQNSGPHFGDFCGTDGGLWDLDMNCDYAPSSVVLVFEGPISSLVAASRDVVRAGEPGSSASFCSSRIKNRCWAELHPPKSRLVLRTLTYREWGGVLRVPSGET